MEDGWSRVVLGWLGYMEMLGDFVFFMGVVFKIIMRIYNKYFLFLNSLILLDRRLRSGIFYFVIDFKSYFLKKFKMKYDLLSNSLLFF